MHNQYHYKGEISILSKRISFIFLRINQYKSFVFQVEQLFLAESKRTRSKPLMLNINSIDQSIVRK